MCVRVRVCLCLKPALVSSSFLLSASPRPLQPWPTHTLPENTTETEKSPRIPWGRHFLSAPGWLPPPKAEAGGQTTPVTSSTAFQSGHSGWPLPTPKKAQRS